MAKPNHITSATNSDHESSLSGVPLGAGDPADAIHEGSPSMNMQAAISALDLQSNVSSGRTWEEALGQYRALKQIADQIPPESEEELHAAVDAYYEAGVHLIQNVRATTVAAVITKLEVVRELSFRGEEEMHIDLAAAVADLRSLSPSSSMAEGGDTELLAADARMQDALREIEMHGTFYTAEEHSPSKTRDYDRLNDLVGKALAKTAQGALAKAWVAWSANTVGGTEEKRRFGDLVRRRDLTSLAAMAHELDWEHHTMLTLIQSLNAIDEQREASNSGVCSKKLASELKRYAEQANWMERLLLRTSSVLDAIFGGGLLDVLPVNSGDPADCGRHNGAVGLLDMLQEEVRRFEESDEFGTDLSIHLEVRAAELRKAG